MNNIKGVRTKEIIMTGDSTTGAITQKQSTEKCLKSTEHIRRETPTPTCKSSESQEAITLKPHVPTDVLPETYRTSQEHPP